MDDDIELIYSPLQQTHTENGKTIDIQIYRGADTGWTLEVVDEYGNSTVWDMRSRLQLIAAIDSDGHKS